MEAHQILTQVGQALVIAVSIAFNDLLYVPFNINIVPHIWSTNGSDQPHIVGFGMARGSEALADRHLFSLYFMLPLIGTCLGLLKWNW